MLQKENIIAFLEGGLYKNKLRTLPFPSFDPQYKTDSDSIKVLVMA